MPTLELIKEVARALGIDSDPGKWGPLVRQAVETAATAFAWATRPASLNALCAKPADLEWRVRTFLARRWMIDPAILENALAVYTAAAADPNRWQRFVQHIPVERLRTYHDPMLVQVVGHFTDWDPAVEWLEGRRPGDAEAEAWFLDFQNKLIGYLMRRLGVTREAAREAVQNALMRELEALSKAAQDPLEARYIYEGPFDGWLRIAAYNACRPHAMPLPRPLFAPGQREGRLTAPPGGPPSLEELSEWYRLVRSTFDDPAKADIVWACMIAEALGEDPDEDLARKLKGVKSAATIRYRLRQRLEVVRYLRSRPPKPDLPGDVSLLAWLKDHKRWDEEGWPTQRKIAALVRAACNEPLDWATLAHYIVDLHVPVRDALAGLPRLGPTTELPARLAAADGYSFDAAQLRWGPLRLGGSGHLIAACWYLKIWRHATEKGAEDALRPGPDDGFAQVWKSV